MSRDLYQFYDFTPQSIHTTGDFTFGFKPGEYYNPNGFYFIQPQDREEREVFRRKAPWYTIAGRKYFADYDKEIYEVNREFWTSRSVAQTPQTGVCATYVKSETIGDTYEGDFTLKFLNNVLPMFTEQFGDMFTMDYDGGYKESMTLDEFYQVLDRDGEVSFTLKWDDLRKHENLFQFVLVYKTFMVREDNGDEPGQGDLVRKFQWQYLLMYDNVMICEEYYPNMLEIAW